MLDVRPQSAKSDVTDPAPRNQKRRIVGAPITARRDVSWPTPAQPEAADADREPNHDPATPHPCSIGRRRDHARSFVGGHSRNVAQAMLP